MHPTEVEMSQHCDAIRSAPPWINDNSNSGYAYQHLFPFASYAPWVRDAAFWDCYRKIEQNTLVDLWRCYELWTLAQQTADIEGDILEIGVWCGGTGALLAKGVQATNKTVYLADTFTGVAKAGSEDSDYVGGEHADASAEMVSTLLNSLNLDRVQVLTGIFPEDTSHLVRGKIALLHCDVDVYQSCKDIVEWALPRLSVGSILIFDDYGFITCDGVTKYCNELRSRSDFRFIYNLNGHAIFIKIS